jgi:hypothetical protein
MGSSGTLEPAGVPFEKANPFLVIDRDRQVHGIEALKKIIIPIVSDFDE